jgi:chromosomal replication initiator protein
MIDASKRPKISPYVFAGLTAGHYGLKSEDYILDIVCRHFDITKFEIVSTSRKRNFVLPRHVVCHLVKKYTLLALKDIGWFMGGRDHSTIIHSIRAIDNLIATDKAFEREYQLIEDKL